MLCKMPPLKDIIVQYKIMFWKREDVAVPALLQHSPYRSVLRTDQSLKRVDAFEAFQASVSAQIDDAREIVWRDGEMNRSEACDGSDVLFGV